MTRLLLIAALLVASVAPSWAQSDARWVALFHSDGNAGRGNDGTSGNRQEVYLPQTMHTVQTMLDRMGVPYREFSIPDSLNGWATVMGDPRDVDEADSTHFRKNGCLGWISVMQSHGATTFDGSSEIFRFFTDANGNTGVQTGSPIDGNWGIPGVMFTTAAVSIPAVPFLNGMNGIVQKASTARVRQAFTNGDSISILTLFAFIRSPNEAANVTPIIYADTLNGTGSAMIAWTYKTSTHWYGISDVPYGVSTPYMLGVAKLFTSAGYTPKRKLNLHIDLDHPYPDATVQTAPIDSFLAYFDARGWRHAGAIEANSSEVADDNVALRSKMNERKNDIPSHPHSHDYLNFGNSASLTGWNFSTYADSATKRARWNDMRKAISDTIGSKLATGYENVATFPNNDVNFPDLYIMAGSGVRDIRVIRADSLGAHVGNLRRWQKVPSPVEYVSGNLNRYGLPYMYIEPKTNRPLYVHDGFEHPISSDSANVALSATDFTTDMEGWSSRNLSGHVRMAIWDGGMYWHPDLNLTSGRFMADVYRRLTYFYGRVSNILTVQPHYLPKTPRKPGGTSRNSYVDNRP